MTKFTEQINIYRSCHKQNHTNGTNNPKRSSEIPMKKNTKNNDPPKTKSSKEVLILGDSMVKHIDEKNISRAAKMKSSCKTYSGATVEKLQDHLESEWCNDGEHYEAIVLHVGTNNLPDEEADAVANKMESLIIKAKNHADNVGVSSVVRRYDYQVLPSKITSLNNSLQQLCTKHQVSFIDNRNIDKSLLNKSNSHLNRNGDRVLGQAFCSYLKSLRPKASNLVSLYPNHLLYPRPQNAREEWTRYLQFVTRMTY